MATGHVSEYTLRLATICVPKPTLRAMENNVLFYMEMIDIFDK